LITVIDLGLGNIGSVGRALSHLGVIYDATADAKKISEAEKLIFPGVGSFYEASQRLEATGLRTVIRDKVLNSNTPILGICLGMQLLATSGEEHGSSEGLGLIEAKVTMHRASGLAMPLPHIGWNNVWYDPGFELFSGIEKDSCFYFVHSYELIPSENVICAYSDYGVPFVAAVKKGNVIGTQFHPEKSQKVGLRLLDNFCKDKY
jgi:imidazole glycerol-phosphate synthase subunit HisH